MSSIAEIVEADVDWFDAVGSIKLVYYPRGDLERQVERALIAAEGARSDLSPGLSKNDLKQITRIYSGGGGRSAVYRRENNDDGRLPKPPRRERITIRLLDEVHDILCDDQKYKEERASLLKEYKAGQTAFVAGVAATLAPHLGAGTEVISAGIAVVLTMAGRMGLKAWCSAQAGRRRISAEQQKEAQAAYERRLRNWEKHQRKIARLEARMQVSRLKLQLQNDLTAQKPSDQQIEHLESWAQQFVKARPATLRRWW